MRLQRIQEFLKEREIEYKYTQEDDCGSLDFMFRGLRFHIWEFIDGDVRGAEANIYNCDRSEDIEGDYETILLEEMETWPKGMK